MVASRNGSTTEAILSGIQGSVWMAVRMPSDTPFSTALIVMLNFIASPFSLMFSAIPVIAPPIAPSTPGPPLAVRVE